MNTEIIFQKKINDNVQWASEFGYFNGLSDSPHPIAPGSRQDHQLMIFNGLHAGASMSLANGTYSLGRSYECDIVLKDPGIAPIHLKVSCDGGAIALRPESGAVYLDGRLVERETVLPEPPVVVSIAGIHFGLAVEGAAWHPLDFPMIHEVAGNLPKKNRQRQIGGDDDKAPLLACDPPLHKFTAGWDRLRRVDALIKIVTAAFALIFIVCAIFLFNVKQPDNAALIAEVEKQFAQKHLPKPAIHVDTEGFLDIISYVPTVTRKKEITAFLQNLPVAVRPHIYVDDQVKQALQDYISRMAFPVVAVYKGNGMAVVKGFAENQHQADVMESLLKNNVTGLRTVNLHILRMDQVRTELAAVLKDAGLENKINLRPQTGHLLAEGTLDAAERSRWQAAKKTIVEHLGRQVEIIDQITDRHTLAGKIDIAIAGVTMQPYPFITLQNGKVYFKGASLKNGTIIKDIGPERIVVEIDGHDYYYNF